VVRRRPEDQIDDGTGIRVVPDAPAPGPGFPLDHPYLEVVYGPLIGPTAIVLARALERAVRRSGGPVGVDVRELARELGLQSSAERSVGPRSSLARALKRLEFVRVARWKERGVLAVVSAVPAVSQRVLDRLPAVARDAHFEYMAELGSAAGGPSAGSSMSAASPTDDPPMDLHT
jgi:hypothetical protein